MLQCYLELEITISALGSRGVAMEVTQPLWPSKVPRKVSCSAIETYAKQTKTTITRPKARLGAETEGAGSQARRRPLQLQIEHNHDELSLRQLEK